MARYTLLLLFASLAIACGGSDDNSSPTAPSEVTGSAPFSTTDLVVGTGAEAMSGQPITVNYTLWLYSDSAAENKGRQVQSSRFSFTLGVGGVIRGWDQGIPGMRVGGRRRLVISPDLGYGNNPPSDIPVNATLLFEVELLSIP